MNRGSGHGHASWTTPLELSSADNPKRGSRLDTNQKHLLSRKI